MQTNWVIVGHGMATQRLLQALVQRGTGTASITVIGDEPGPAYNRILLSSLLAGEITEAELPLATADWYSRHGIECLSGDPVVEIDRQRQQVRTLQGRCLAYDRLVLATGSRPARPSIPGMDLPGVFDFRTLKDTRALLERAQSARSAIVIGGGFLGLEAAEGLRCQGVEVTLLHRNRHLLNRQLDPTAGALLTKRLRQRGLNIHLNADPTSLFGDERVQGVRLIDGTERVADLIVVATGIRPNIELAAAAGLDCDRAIRVDAGLRTSDPAIHALGECCQFNNHTYGLVEPIYRQAEVLAAILCGESAHYQEAPVATRLKISGIELFSCGRINPGPATESLIYEDREAGEYRHLLLQAHRLVGAVLYGDARHGPWYYEQIQRAADLSLWRAQLVFGPAFCEAAA